MARLIIVVSGRCTQTPTISCGYYGKESEGGGSGITRKSESKKGRTTCSHVKIIVIKKCLLRIIIIIIIIMLVAVMDGS